MHKLRPFSVQILAGLALVLSVAAAHAQSFNCRYAKSADEVLICQDARLAALDGRLAGAYSGLHRQVSGAQRVRLERDQGAWLRKRRQCGRDAACIAEMYQSRIGALTVSLALPKALGECVTTTIEKISDRFGAPIGGSPRPDGMGSAVVFANGGSQVSYEWEAALARSRVGDKVRMCLVSIPQDCPPGDSRGRRYTTTNLRTDEAWTLPDSQHMCGGA